jgi:phospholipid/cholesterol/gamma-HCH transport system substrate-binding protein
MENHTPQFKARLGIFIAVGIAFFVIAIFIIGKQQNLFNPCIQNNNQFLQYKWPSGWE